MNSETQARYIRKQIQSLYEIAEITEGKDRSDIYDVINTLTNVIKRIHNV
jgi:predicted DNA-binding protein YlxM (UPF0122 family)